MGKEPDNGGAEEAQAAGEIKGVLSACGGCFPAAIGNDIWEDVVANESTDLAHCRSNGVVLATDTCAARLGRDKADVVSRSDLTKRQEHAVDNNEATNVRGLLEITVSTGHDEPNGTLNRYKDAQSESRTEPITHVGANLCSSEYLKVTRTMYTHNGTGHVEQVDQRRPTETLPERRVRGDGGDPGRGEDAEGIGQEIVDKPNGGYNQQAEPVELEGEPVRSFLVELLTSE